MNSSKARFALFNWYYVDDLQVTENDVRVYVAR